MTSLQSLAAPAGRLLLAFLFIAGGIGKISGFERTATYMNAMGVPGSLLPIVIALEILGGFAIVLGWKTRLVAFLLAGFTVLSAIIFHSDFAIRAETISFMKNLSIAGGFLLLAAHGPGDWALDNRRA